MQFDADVEAMLKTMFEAGMLSAKPELAENPLFEFSVSTHWSMYKFKMENHGLDFSNVRLVKV